VRLVFAGTPAAAVPALDALLGSAHEVVAVLTRPPAPAGRGRREAASPVAERCTAAGVPVLTPRRLDEPGFLATLAGLAPDCCPVVAYGLLVPPAALAVPPQGWVNLHFSVLPAWRGAAPVQHALLAGDDVTGATTFRLDEGLDTGPILGVLTEPVRPADTTGDLLGRLAVAGARLLVATLDGLAAGEVVAVPQPAAGGTTAPRLTVADARVDWTVPALRVERLVRACTPAPGAWTVFRGGRLKLGPVSPEPEPEQVLSAGELRAVGSGVLVGTGSTPVRLGEVQPAGRRAVPADDWAHGARPMPGELFEGPDP
jgi:methionyl-tRNA formyltransferase